MLGRILKVGKKVRKSVVKIEKKPDLGACDCLEKENTVSFSVVYGMQSYNGNGVQQLRYARTATTVPSPLSFTAVLTDEPLRTEHNFTTFSV